MELGRSYAHPLHAWDKHRILIELCLFASARTIWDLEVATPLPYTRERDKRLGTLNFKQHQMGLGGTYVLQLCIDD